MLRRLLFALFIYMGIYGTISAQSGGQMCVRSFEDRNGNGQIDAGEPLLTRGVGVNLLNSEGITIASSLLDTSPTAAQGVVCFQFLPAGQYSVVITSADYTATTPDTITTTVTDGGLPTVVEFGAQHGAAPEPAATEAPQQPDATRIVLSGAGMVLVLLVMAFLGVVVYWFAFGRRPQPALDMRRTTGSVRAVTSTAELRRVHDAQKRDTGTTRRVPDDSQ